MKRVFPLFGVFTFCLCATMELAAPDDWAEGTPEKDNGATRDYYNRAGYLAWKNKMGDWMDAKGVAHPMINTSIWIT